MSMFTKYFWDPAKNLLARTVSSSTAPAPQKAAAQAALDAYTKISADASTAIQGALTGQSPAAAASPVISDLETGATAVVDAYAGSLVAGIPVVGSMLAPEAVALLNTGLAFGEQHLHDLIAGLFAQKKADVTAAALPQN